MTFLVFSLCGEDVSSDKTFGPGPNQPKRSKVDSATMLVFIEEAVNELQ